VSPCFELVLDDAYYREFHGEMVATQLPRWRLHQRVAWASWAVGAAMLGWTVLSLRADTLGVALVAGLVGGALSWRLHRRRKVWLRNQRRQAAFGTRLTVVVGDHQLTQRSDRAADMHIRSGRVLPSPRGWFVSYDTVFLDDDEPVEMRSGALYLPARSLAEIAAVGAVERALKTALDVHS